ncbi:MAG: glutamate--tRNA ligase family protein [Candidatus Pacearchaeota archaeon]
MKNLDKKIRAYALKNAIAYEGKARQGAVISGLFAEGLKKEDVKKIIKDVSKIVNEVNKLSLEEQEKEFEKLKKETHEREHREGLEELPNANKGVVMRFRPSPSGPLHIGHIISNIVNSLYVKKYGGKFYVIIDDTNPENVLKDSYKKIKEDCDWVFGNVTKYLNSSDRMVLYYRYAEDLINKKFAYVCTCSAERFRKFSEFQEDCPCRNNELKENIYRWKKMFDEYKEGEAVLRFKTQEGMKHPNPAMRDFPLARINLTEHPLQKKKYRVWPLMNLAVAVDDIELKTTHIIRGKDHRDNAERQKMIFEVFGKKYPWSFFMGRIKFKDLVLSKRKITQAIESGEFSGVEDERLPTIASLRKRKYNMKVFERFAEQRGLTEVDKVVDSKEFFLILDSFNK